MGQMFFFFLIFSDDVFSTIQMLTFLLPVVIYSYTTLVEDITRFDIECPDRISFGWSLAKKKK